MVTAAAAFNDLAAKHSISLETVWAASSMAHLILSSMNISPEEALAYHFVGTYLAPDIANLVRSTKTRPATATKKRQARNRVGTYEDALELSAQTLSLRTEIPLDIAELLASKFGGPAHYAIQRLIYDGYVNMVHTRNNLAIEQIKDVINGLSYSEIFARLARDHQTQESAEGPPIHDTLREMVDSFCLFAMKAQRSRGNLRRDVVENLDTAILAAARITGVITPETVKMAFKAYEALSSPTIPPPKETKPPGGDGNSALPVGNTVGYPEFNRLLDGPERRAIAINAILEWLRQNGIFGPVAALLSERAMHVAHAALVHIFTWAEIKPAYAQVRHLMIPILESYLPLLQPIARSRGIQLFPNGDLDEERLADLVWMLCDEIYPIHGDTSALENHLKRTIEECGRAQIQGGNGRRPRTTTRRLSETELTRLELTMIKFVTALLRMLEDESSIEVPQDVKEFRNRLKEVLDH
jgi:hypothetical protein